MKPYNEALAVFMEKKADWMNRELSIQRDMYFTTGDREEIMSWSEDDAKDIWKRLKDNVNHHHCSGLRYELCPFCHKYGYKHEECGVVIKNQICEVCGYGYRHGPCTDQRIGKSQYRTILRTFEVDRVDMYRFFSVQYYQDMMKEIEDTIIKKPA
jgi:hypothetical protein